MPAKNPRVNVVLEPPVYRGVQRLARRDGVSLSLEVRDLVREALQLREDVLLAEAAEAREKTFSRGKALSHEATWAHLKKSRA